MTAGLASLVLTNGRIIIVNARFEIARAESASAPFPAQHVAF
jgi:hypothetical protein